jgi:hypothetical protein
MERSDVMVIPSGVGGGLPIPRFALDRLLCWPVLAPAPHWFLAGSYGSARSSSQTRSDNGSGQIPKYVSAPDRIHREENDHG